MPDNGLQPYEALVNFDEQQTEDEHKRSSACAHLRRAQRSWMAIALFITVITRGMDTDRPFSRI